MYTCILLCNCDMVRELKCCLRWVCVCTNALCQTDFFCFERICFDSLQQFFLYNFSERLDLVFIDKYIVLWTTRKSHTFSSVLFEIILPAGSSITYIHTAKPRIKISCMTSYPSNSRSSLKNTAQVWMFIYRIYAATPHFFRTFVNIPINFVNKFLQKPQGLKPISREMELSVIMKQLSALWLSAEAR